MFCRKIWIKEPEDHGGRLSELHEVPDVPLQFPYICKYSEFSFCPEPSCSQQPCSPVGQAVAAAQSIPSVTEGSAASKDAQPFSTELFLSLARGSSGKAVTSGVRGLSLNGKRNCRLVLGVRWETQSFSYHVFLVTLLLLSVARRVAAPSHSVVGWLTCAWHWAVPCRRGSSSTRGLPA